MSLINDLAETKVVENKLEPVAYSIKDTLCILGISRTLLWKSISAGEIRAVRLGRRTLVPKSEITRLVAGVSA